MRYLSLHREGQSIVETILILPIFLFFVFALIQLGQIGVAMVTASYAAGSIARHAVQEDSANGPRDFDRLNNLMFGGMKAVVVNETSQNSLLPDIQVNACIHVNPLPFVGDFLNSAIHYTDSANGQADSCTDTAPTPVYFVPQGNGGRNYFIVKGSASARMNYHP